MSARRDGTEFRREGSLRDLDQTVEPDATMTARPDGLYLVLHKPDGRGPVPQAAMCRIRPSAPVRIDELMRLNPMNPNCRLADGFLYFTQPETPPRLWTGLGEERVGAEPAVRLYRTRLH
jgi:hypothetical protein